MPQARLRRSSAIESAAAAWCGQEVLLPAPPPTGRVNANGAGDAFTAGLLAAMLWSSPLSLVDAVGLALGSALQQIDMGCKQRRTAAEILSSLSADPSR